MSTPSPLLCVAPTLGHRHSPGLLPSCSPGQGPPRSQRTASGSPRGRLPRPSLGPVLAPPSPGLGWGFSSRGRVLGCLFLPIHTTPKSRAASCHWLLGAQSPDLAHSTCPPNGKEEGGEEERGKGEKGEPGKAVRSEGNGQEQGSTEPSEFLMLAAKTRVASLPWGLGSQLGGVGTTDGFWEPTVSPHPPAAGGRASRGSTSF